MDVSHDYEYAIYLKNKFDLKMEPIVMGGIEEQEKQPFQNKKVYSLQNWAKEVGEKRSN